MRPEAPRPPRPYSDPLWSTYDTETRGRLNMEWRLATTDWWLNGNGWRRVDTYQGHEVCVECLACGATENGSPVNGRDSHGDCAADGEPVWYVVPIEEG